MARTTIIRHILSIITVTSLSCALVASAVIGEEVDECATNAHNCNDNALCEDTKDSFTCTCNAGFTGDGVNCADLDECELGTHNCSEPAECDNSPPGSYTCMCNEGYSEDGYTCVDIDECAIGADNCNEHALCVNTDGSFYCTANTHPRGGDNMCEWKRHIGSDQSTFNTFMECDFEAGSQISEQHYTTMDGQRYKFQGDGYYIMTETSTTDLPQFTISSGNGAAKPAKWKKKKWGFWLVIGKFSLCIGRRFTSASSPMGDTEALVNGMSQNLPITYSTEDGRVIHANSEPDGIKVTTNFGVMIESCGESGFTVHLSREYWGKVRGMLGDFDGNSGNDMMLPDGTRTRDSQKFGEAWRDTSRNSDMDAESMCGDISDPRGPFHECHSELSPEHFAEICRSDFCATDGSMDAVCAIYNHYACKCADRGVIVDWRTDTFCSPECGANAHYALTTTPCVNTCINPSAAQDCHVQNLPVSGCVCDEGHVLSDETCVPLDQCGCVEDGNVYHKLGDVWSKDCDTICTCTAYDTIECEDVYSCPSDMTCSPQPDGSSACVCEQGAGCAPECSKQCSVTESGTLRTPISLGSQLPGDSTIILTSTGDDTDACKVSITVVTDAQGGIVWATVAVGAHPNPQLIGEYANNFDFINGNVNMRPAFSVSIPLNFPFGGWDDGSVFVSIEEITAGSIGWILKVHCGQGSQHRVTFTFASQDLDTGYVNVYVSDPDIWTQECFG